MALAAAALHRIAHTSRRRFWISKGSNRQPEDERTTPENATSAGRITSLPQPSQAALSGGMERGRSTTEASEMLSGATVDVILEDLRTAAKSVPVPYLADAAGLALSIFDTLQSRRYGYGSYPSRIRHIRPQPEVPKVMHNDPKN
ncbi:hypothetical protein K435DRAFT_885293 [Dendrothele bispora CBS 962.96]|uniref:Uncharacterized protein n=1 Tax=Dendrothele bispora (strain CBS 962.96) TaxID=1314807 RepID=A0A4S8M8Q2_DENBC|nr:hypothetical protein K435DRAFT_885293 [Dendrothele bispora CBS 962.96]